jgi:hypothetical protein
LNERLLGDIGKIDYLLDKYSYILKEFKEQEPNDRDLLAISNLLHTFYNGIERIFTTIAEEYDNNIVTGENSHKFLLNEMRKSFPIRTVTLSEDLYIKLSEYMGYRHMYRHAYSFELKWNKMKHLVDNIYDVWEEVKDFITKIENED